MRKKFFTTHHLARNILYASLFSVLVILVVGRIYLPYWAKDYVNTTLNNIDGYRGSVEGISIALYRGAYVIHDLKLYKIDKGIPSPFLDFARADLSIQWGALFKGRIVGDVTLDRPTINFAKSSSGQSAQTGVETDWTRPIKELMPLDINFVEINNGKIAYQDFSTEPNVDVYIDKMHARATNLRNINDRSEALPSDLTVRGSSIGGGNLQLDGKLNILKQIPDFDIAGKLESIDLPAMNNYARPFAGIDFEKGRLDIYTELAVKNGAISGYVKPLATEVYIIDPEPDSAIKFIWEVFVAAVADIFTNSAQDQFATQIVIEGQLDSPETNIWRTIGAIFRNAFVQAFSRTITPE